MASCQTMCCCTRELYQLILHRVVPFETLTMDVCGFFSAWFRHFELSLKQTLVSLEVGCFSIVFDHSSTDWSSTDPVILQFLPDALDALRSSGPHWCLAGHAPRRAPSRCGATRASWPSQDHRNVGTNHWQCVIPRIKLHSILDAFWTKRMSSSLSRFGWSFQRCFFKAEAEIGRCKETFLSGTVSKQYSIFGLEGLVARKTRMGHQKDFILQGGLK